LWVLDSGRGYFCRVDPDLGKAEQVVFCPGLARGLSFWRGYALIGTSLPRDGAFKGLELDGNTKRATGSRVAAPISSIRAPAISCIRGRRAEAVRRCFHSGGPRADVRRRRQSGDTHADHLP
jgi:hypothetical protein